MKNPVIKGLGNDIPVHTIFCIGRNYAEHVRELNSEMPRTIPVIFTKPLTSIVYDGGSVNIPGHTSNVHHEAEVVVAIGREGRNIPREEALGYVAGYAIGIDMTARDVQDKLKEKGNPWDLAKGPDTFAPLGNFISPEQCGDPGAIDIELSVNGEVRQKGTTAHMLFPVDALISILSQYFTLHPGDLIFTGTPEGVSRVVEGDTIEAGIAGGQSRIRVSVKNESATSRD
jgi:2-keto-4-pentenoate hydratase/2-oxohepta-3-ene-1,7-dioic acid hydratase in catechol pathway